MSGGKHGNKFAALTLSDSDDSDPPSEEGVSYAITHQITTHYLGNMGNHQSTTHYLGIMGNVDLAVYHLLPDEKFSDFEHGLSILNPRFLPIKFYDEVNKHLVYNRFDCTLVELLNKWNSDSIKPDKTMKLSTTKIEHHYTGKKFLRLISDMIAFVEKIHTSSKAARGICVQKFGVENIVVIKKQFYFWKVKFCELSLENKLSAYECIGNIVRFVFGKVVAPIPSDVESLLKQLEVPHLQPQDPSKEKLLLRHVSILSYHARLCFCKDASDKKYASNDIKQYRSVVSMMKIKENWNTRFESDALLKDKDRLYGAMTRCYVKYQNDREGLDDESGKNERLVRYIRNCATHLRESIDTQVDGLKRISDKETYNFIHHFFGDEILQFHDVMYRYGPLQNFVGL